MADPGSDRDRARAVPSLGRRGAALSSSDDKKKKGSAAAPSPWLAGVSSVTGVVPSGRRFSPATERRATAWSASGVRGVRPPGKLKVGEGPAVLAAEKAERKRLVREKAERRAKDPAKGAAPADLKTFLERIADFIKALELSEDAAENLGELITQSHAPYEITVAFTMLSAIVGKNAALRKRFTPPLERGAKTFFNLARRLSPEVKPPRGLMPETMDAIFHDLPSTAYQVPYAFATDALGRMIELLRRDPKTDRKLVGFAIELRAEQIEGRTLGNKPLAGLFPWSPPHWGVDEDER